MDRKTANIESQIQIWALLGPFVLLLSFVLGFYKLSSQHYYLALIPIVAIPLCLRWRAVGMLAAPVVATVLVFFLYGSLPQSERYWLVGMAMTVSLGMIVTALAMEEVRGLVGCLRQESSSRLENLLRLDEKLRSAEGEWRQQEAGYLRQLQSLQVDVDEKTCTLHRYSELVPQLHGELASMEESRDTLLLELEKNRSDRAKLDQQLHDAQAEIRGLSDAYSMSQGEREKACHKKIGDLEAAIANADQEFIDLHGRLEYAESASMEARANVQQLERYLDGLRQEKEEAC
ncbi:MAG: hypothetical protein KDK78_02600, partial [Chlamydiia bacterium]|nr:hypothetical protein [Chlamydiia bacterium]